MPAIAHILVNIATLLFRKQTDSKRIYILRILCGNYCGLFRTTQIVIFQGGNVEMADAENKLNRPVTARVAAFAILFFSTTFAAISATSAASCTGSSANTSGNTPGPASAGRDNSIDYAGLNRLLLVSDQSTRLQQLPAAISALGSSAEALAVRARLQLALAQTQANADQINAAIATLKIFPLDNSQAPAAIFLLAQLEARAGHKDNGVHWLRQLADLFPDNTLAVRGLLQAAEWNSHAAPALLQQATQQADQGLVTAQQWQQRSLEKNFMESVNVETLPSGLWHLARATLISASFSTAESAQNTARQQLQCLVQQQESRLQLQQKNPLLLSDIAVTASSLDVQLKVASAGLAARESQFMASAQAWKACKVKAGDCTTLKTDHDTQGRALTGWRNRVHDLEKKREFLLTEQKALPARWQQEQKNSVAAVILLVEKQGEMRRVMRDLLQETLKTSVQDWEALAATAHYQLALAQDPRVPLDSR
jgi:uncharacterized protein YjiS (DUF1127 family)